MCTRKTLLVAFLFISCFIETKGERRKTNGKERERKRAIETKEECREKEGQKLTERKEREKRERD